MRIVVTGVSGQLVQSLGERAHQFPNIELIKLGRPQLNLEKPGDAIPAILAAAPDIVINAAAYTNVDQAEVESERAFRLNAEAAGEIAEAAEQIGAAIVQISTDYVFDGQRVDPYDEDAPTNPLSVYGRSKLEGEERVRAANSQFAIVRTAWVYSPFGRNFVKSIMLAAGTCNEITVVQDQRGNPTSALDLADGLLSMIETGAGWGQTYNLAGTGAASWYEFAVEIMANCKALGLPNVPIVPIGKNQWSTRAVRPSNSMLNSEKFRRAFGFKMPEWRSSLRQTIGRL